ncbi:MAG: hypothetical protein GYA63_05625, partial [Armatimonadetes bacterium]|nr:hypothetical protein [Armatimonadota bacterium]
PARHTYRITDSGRQHLREWKEVLENLAVSMQNFVAGVRALDASEEVSSLPDSPR